METLRKLFEGDASSKMKLDLEEVDSGSSGDSGPATLRRRKGKGKTPERAWRPAGGHPHDSDPFFTASNGDGRDCRHTGEWLAEEAETSPWSRRVRMRISLLPTGARTPLSARPRRLGGATWTRMMTWTLVTRRSPHPRIHRGDPAEAHRDPLAEDHQDPLEDAHRVDPREADPPAGEDPLDRVGLAEALLEDPLGTPTTHRKMVTRRPPGGGSSTSAGGSRPSSER